MEWNKINEARRFLGIEDYPGNLFKLFEDTQSIINEKKIVLFKEDIDKLSGFIGYSSGYTIICINYKRNIGHQNFTLAHEIGHMFLHRGISKSDENPESSGGAEELEANLFAKELLYPKEYATIDLQYILDNKLTQSSKWDELAEYINKLSIKYCTSFKFTFNRLFENQFRNYNEKNQFYKKFKKHVGKFANRFPNDSHLHVVVDGHEYYKEDYQPYEYMKVLVKKLIDSKNLGLETGECIIDKYESLEGRL